MALYPIFLKLEGHKVLVVGGGAIAEQKIEGVLRSANDLTVVSPTLTPRLQLWAEQGRLLHVCSEYRPGMAQGYFLVIAATDCEKTNRAVYDEARSAGTLANAVDDPEHCDFYAPALVSRGDFQVAVSTGGKSPALAQRVRKELDLQFGPEYEGWISWLGRMRESIRSVLPRTESRKELLHLLALCQPARNFNPQNTGGNNGPFEKG
ncbi:MAG TPA: bifunctional precorrin-2 dehydrogenase/sirohydrochlorin ferrochelatase [Candidatus Angelobacter sp.]|nr:bifunctional precorrin-2 dehydrogenase/sirohydrochlorin ferrochelatase [Candidatus Angelobacter sp.]